MSRITKENAKEIAKKLTEAKYKGLKDLRNQFHEELTQYVKENTPADIVAVVEKHPDYFKKESKHFIALNHTIGYYSSIFPTQHQQISIYPDEKAAYFLKFERRIKGADKSLFDLIIDLENTLFNLRTYKNVSEQLPEAIPFLVPKENSGIMLNIADIRARL